MLNLLLYMLLGGGGALVTLLLGVVVHEAGHLVAGLASGYSFSSFSLFGLVWVREDGKVRLRRNKNSLVAGQCLMLPPPRLEDFRFALYNAGGGLANLLLGAVFLLLWFLPHQAWLRGLGMVGCLLNLVLAATNLLPLKMNIPNDGMNLKMAKKSPLAARGLHAMLVVNEEIRCGKRYRDYAAEDFEPNAPVDKANYFETYFWLLQAGRLGDLQDNEGAMQAYSRLDLQVMHPYYATLVRIDYLYAYLLHYKDYEHARALYQMKDVQKLLQTPLPTLMRARVAALFFLEGKQAEGRALLQKARQALPQSPSKGLQLMETDYIAELEAAMDAVPAAG